MFIHYSGNICAFKILGFASGNKDKIVSALDRRKIIPERCPDDSSGAVSFNRIADLLTCGYAHTTNSRAVIL